MSKRFSFAGLNIALLNPKGFIAVQQKHLLLMTILLMLIVVVPAYVMLIRFGLKYRAGNKKTERLEFNHHAWLIWLWWIVPASVIAVLAVSTWHSTHALDPHKEIASQNPPITIQVVALQWKWLFIYPEQHIATVNFVEFPVNTPVKFEMTADNATMNSLWIPQLGGQMYAMTSMSSMLNLMANEVGDYRGSAAEINGPGLAGMQFIARATSQKDFDQWVGAVKLSGNALTNEKYSMLVKPSENNPQTYYSEVDPNMYNSIIAKYSDSMHMTH